MSSQSSIPAPFIRLRKFVVLILVVVCFCCLISSTNAKSAPPIRGASNTNQQWYVAKLPKGKFQASRHLSMMEDPFDADAIELGPDQVLIRMEAFSIDAFVRTMLEQESFHFSFKPGDRMRAIGYGTVVRAGSNTAYKVGSRVVGMLPVSKFSVVDKSPSLMPMASFPGVKPCLTLGLLGTSGLSAYIGTFLATSKPPKKGETVVVSAAAGGVGTCVAQMAKLTGARVVGIAGGPKKKDFLLNTMGLDAAVDYKDNTRSMADQLAEACPDGIDFFFDNVGGDTLDAVLDQINQGARVVICGAISQYDTGRLYSDPQGPKNYLKLAERSATMSGFVMSHYLSSPKHVFWAVSYILWNYYRGKLKSYEMVEEGIESFGSSLEKMLNGENLGRLIVRVDGEL